MNKRIKRRLRRRQELAKATKLMLAEGCHTAPKSESKPTGNAIPRKSRRNKYYFLAHPEQKPVQEPPKPTVTSSVTAKFKEKLLGGRFRQLSEQFYLRTGEEAKDYFTANKASEFIAYHRLYKEQLGKWPEDPLSWVVAWIKKHCKKHSVVVDLGCGSEARLAKQIPFKCRSFDLVSLSPEVEACNYADEIPMGNCSADVCVFCLSLMTTDSGRSVRQANRILKDGGTLLVVELSSRLDHTRRKPHVIFVRTLEDFGFTCSTAKVEEYFCYFVLTKTGKAQRRSKKIPLTPCLYKKR